MEDMYSFPNYRKQVLHWTLIESPSVTYPSLNQLCCHGPIRTHSMSWSFVSPSQITQLQASIPTDPLLCPCHAQQDGKQVASALGGQRQGDKVSSRDV